MTHQEYVDRLEKDHKDYLQEIIEDLRKATEAMRNKNRKKKILEVLNENKKRVRK